MQSEDAEMREMGYHKEYVVHCKDCVKQTSYYHGQNSNYPLISHFCWEICKDVSAEGYCEKGVLKE